MPPKVEELAIDVLLEQRVLRPRACPNCGTVWAPVPSRLVAVPTAGLRSNYGPNALYAADDGSAYLYCCSLQVIWY